jgi:hypothetical protein
VKVLTEKQSAIFWFVHARIRAGRAPTIKEIGSKFRITSTAVFDHLRLIIKKGYLRRDGLLARGLALGPMIAQAGAEGCCPTCGRQLEEGKAA